MIAAALFVYQPCYMINVHVCFTLGTVLGYASESVKGGGLTSVPTHGFSLNFAS